MVFYYVIHLIISLFAEIKLVRSLIWKYVSVLTTLQHKPSTQNLQKSSTQNLQKSSTQNLKNPPPRTSKNP